MTKINLVKRLLDFIDYNKKRLETSYGKEKYFIKQEIRRAETEILKLKKDKVVKEYFRSKK